MADAEELKFTVVFNKETGQLVSATQDVEKFEKATLKAGAAGKSANAQISEGAKTAAESTKGVGKAAEEAGEHGKSGFGKIENKVAEMATGIFLGQLALEGFKRVAQQSDAFTNLQTTLEDTTSTLVNDLAPALDVLSRGLQALVVWAGGILGLLAPISSTALAMVRAFMDEVVGLAGAAINLVQGNFKGAWESVKQIGKDIQAEAGGLADEWETGINKLVASFGDGVDRINGKSKAFTKQRAEELNAAIEAEIAHNDNVLKIKEGFLQAEANAVGATYEQREALIDKQEALELANLERNEELKAQTLKNKREAHLLTEQQFQTQLTALQRKGADDRASVEAKATLQRTANAQREKAALVQSFQQTEQAFVSAVVGQIQAGKDLQTALRAGAGAIIQTASEQAAKVIMIKGAEAAATSFAAAGNPVAGAIAAAGTLAWYAGLAAIVGGAGAALGSAVSGTGGNESQAQKMSTAPAGGSASRAEADTPSAAAPSGGGYSGGGGAASMNQINVNVLLDSEVLLRVVQQASFNGKLEIAARAIAGS